MPNLRKLVLEFEEPNIFHPAALHANFAQHLRSLSKHCTIQMQRGFEFDDDSISIGFDALPSCISFIRRSKLAQCYLWVPEKRASEASASVPTVITHYYIGDQEMSVSCHAYPSFLRQLRQHGNNLRGLELEIWNSSSFPRRPIPYLHLCSFLHPSFSNRPQSTPRTSSPKVQVWQ